MCFHEHMDININEMLNEWMALSEAITLTNKYAAIKSALDAGRIRTMSFLDQTILKRVDVLALLKRN